MAPAATQEASTSHVAPLRRARPPNLDLAAAEENRIPLRQDKVNRRDSRLGFKNIFGRSRTAKEDTTPPDDPKLGPIRDSYVDVGSVPYDEVSEASLSPTLSRPLSITVESAEPDNANVQQPAPWGKWRGSAPKPKQPRNDVAQWDCPPLFKAYPQAVRHATLPASTVSADAIVRFHEKSNRNSGVPSLAEDEHKDDKDGAKDKGAWKSKRRHRRDTSSSASSLNLEWTSKVYILTTSGYLLQYSGDGSFNRLPEQTLRLGKTSAAFVSDAIPGRHWVLQVSSSTESDGTPNADSRSLFSKLTFRGTERRSVGNLLLIFESAKEMETWHATLRREIEQLGGKKTLSETGKPKLEDEDTQRLRQQTSQRTLVRRDPHRFSQAMTSEPEWQDDDWEFHDESDSAATVTDTDTTRGCSVDEMSITTSVMSSGGRQLDALRDSTNRLSYLSSGQRTVITSAGSSPACSPTVDSFPTQPEEHLQKPEARLRPNARAIVDRRKSMLTMGGLDEPNAAGSGTPATRPLSYNISATDGDILFTPGDGRAPVQMVRSRSSNSVPRRPAYARAPSSEIEPSYSPLSEAEPAPRGSGMFNRRPPPTSLRLSRPLSMVADQPSPREVTHDRPATRHETLTVPDAGSGLSAYPRPMSRGSEAAPRPEFPTRQSSLIHREPIPAAGLPTSPRRLSSMGALRACSDANALLSDSRASLRPVGSQTLGVPRSGARFERPERCYSTINVDQRSRNRSPAARAPKRLSMYSEPSHYSVRNYAPVPLDMQAPHGTEPSPPPLLGPPPSGPLPPVPSPSARSRTSMMGRAPLNRRSMTHLADGPPPAPPPTCALPPIPQREPNMI